MIESKFQKKVVDSIRSLYPDCLILKNDPNYIQGIPDLMVLIGSHWCALECKRSINAPISPNQEYYVSKMNDMSFASFVYPENLSEVLDAIQQAFGAGR